MKVGYAPLIVGLIAISIGYVAISTPSGAKIPNVPEKSPTKWLSPWLQFKLRVFLNEFFQAGMRATSSHRDRVMDLATSYYKSEVVYMLTHHKIFDAVAEKPMSCIQVATFLQLKPHVVCEFMQAGSKLDLLLVDQSGLFSPSLMGELLQTNVEGSLRDETLFLNEETRQAWRASATLSANTGKSGWEEAFGEEAFRWFELHAAQSLLMNRARLSVLEREAGVLLADLVLPRDDVVICDIGGGAGETMVHFLEHYPNIKVVVVDKPYLSLHSMQLFVDKGLTSRATFMGAFFFAPILPAPLKETCDVFLLKHILHEWDNETSKEILEKVKQVAKAGSKVVIAERVLDTGGPYLKLTKTLQSVGLIASTTDGKERAFDEYRRLFSRAGFVNEPRLVQLRDALSIIEIQV